MRRLTLVLGAMLMAMVAWGAGRPMLEQGKMWVYVYHHFEADAHSYEEGHTTWEVFYKLEGETVIDGRQYMKMYRWDDRGYGKSYYGAFREEDGKVYMYDYLGDRRDFKLIDFTLQYDDQQTKEWTGDVLTETSTIKVDGRQLQRYTYRRASDGQPTGIVAVEGVGFKKTGLVDYVFMPAVNCVCDYQELAAVYGSGLNFVAENFDAPSEILLTDDERRLVSRNNDFAFSLFRQVRKEDDVLVSPLSITFALGMLNNGASGQTQREINNVLGFDDAAGINAFCHKLLTESSRLDTQTRAILANTIYVNNRFQLQAPFVQTAHDYYDAQPESRDFADGQTLNAINQWASDHTEGMIPKVLSPQEFKPQSVSYLLNALYFKGRWTNPFEASETRDEVFDGKETVPMMHSSNAERTYTENDVYQAVVLPYGNGAYQMTVYLPRVGKTIGDVLELLNGEDWQVKGCSYEVDLKLPRFETEANIGLKPVMSALGMPTVFDCDRAEFPYFCNEPVYIDMMKQLAKIKVDEQGTEAAAVTAIGMATTSIPETVELHADRPFLYVVSEQSTGAIFFIGQFTNKVDGARGASLDASHLPSTVADAPLYNLSGQRLANPPRKGIYVSGTKKVVKP